MLRELIASGVETPDGVSLNTANNFAPGSDASFFRGLHQGYIFVLSGASDQDLTEPWFNPSDFTSQIVSPIDSFEAPNTPLSDLNTGRHSRNVLRRMNSIDAEDGAETDENVLTPRPDLNRSFFEQEACPESSVKQRPPSNWSPSANGKFLPCLCCTLLQGENHPETDCICGHCCTCVPAGLINQAKCSRASGTFVTPCTTEYSARSSKGGFSQRSWAARLAAVRSAISLLPVDMPHLVLLTREPPNEPIRETTSCGFERTDYSVGKAESQGINSSGMSGSARPSEMSPPVPLIYPASSLLFSQFMRHDLSNLDFTSGLNTTVWNYADDKNAQSPLDSTTEEGDELFDWMHEGTHVLGEYGMLSSSFLDVY